MAFKTVGSSGSFGGKLLQLTHEAKTTGCQMALNLYLPPQATTQTVPVLFYLAGLTCTGDNGAQKGYFQHGASQNGIAVVYPDTSPRGLNIQGEDDSWDFGTGAGFYLDATKEPYSKGYKMYSYLTEELPKALFSHFEQLDGERVSIMGHSMGGHGALTMYLRNPGKYKSVSAFAPISNPSQAEVGQKAFKGYLGGDQAKWKDYDATELVKNWKGPLEALIDVGTDDHLYKAKALLPENFAAAAKSAGVDHTVELRFHPGYDHSYYFISTFADDHIDHAAKHLFAQH